MATLFISDLHLHSKRCKLTDVFLHFLQNEALDADALYIIGDLFEFWIGDDNSTQLYYKTTSAIKKLVNSGVPCYFIHGNRDFLIGNTFAQDSGVKILPERHVLNLYGHRILIMHGDILCTNDIRYQYFRSKLCIPWVKKMFLSLPLIIRNLIVKQIRSKSDSLKKKKSLFVMDVDLTTVINFMEKYQVQWLIHGHTHTPNIHKLIVNGKPAFRVVLGAWYKKCYLAKVSSKGIELTYLHSK